MAGLWDVWRDADGEQLYTFTIIIVRRIELITTVVDLTSIARSAAKKDTVKRAC
jgi:hypothetical protein